VKDVSHSAHSWLRVREVEGLVEDSSEDGAEFRLDTPEPSELESLFEGCKVTCSIPCGSSNVTDVEKGDEERVGAKESMRV
jgi:hypothetical protein